MGCHFPLQEIFPSRGLSPGLLHCRQTFYHLSHQGSILQSLKQSRKYLILALLLDFFHQREFIIDHVSEIDQFSSVQLSRSVVSDSLWSHGLQHARFPCPSVSPEFAQNHVHWVGEYTHNEYKENGGNRNKISGLYQCLLPGSDVTVQFQTGQSGQGFLCVVSFKMW